MSLDGNNIIVSANGLMIRHIQTAVQHTMVQRQNIFVYDRNMSLFYSILFSCNPLYDHLIVTQETILENLGGTTLFTYSQNIKKRLGHI